MCIRPKLTIISNDSNYDSTLQLKPTHSAFLSLNPWYAVMLETLTRFQVDLSSFSFIQFIHCAEFVWKFDMICFQEFFFLQEKAFINIAQLSLLLHQLSVTILSKKIIAVFI